MQTEERIFKYQIQDRIGELVTILGIVILSVFVLDADFTNAAKIGFTLLFFGFLIFMLNYSYILNDHLKVTEEGLIFHKRIGQSRSIKFSEIRRVVIREEPDAYSSTHFAMTVFGSEDNVRIIVSALEHYHELIELLEGEAAQSDFKLIHQGLNGEILGKSSA